MFKITQMNYRKVNYECVTDPFSTLRDVIHQKIKIGSIFLSCKNYFTSQLTSYYLFEECQILKQISNFKYFFKYKI